MIKTATIVITLLGFFILSELPLKGQEVLKKTDTILSKRTIKRKWLLQKLEILKQEPLDTFHVEEILIHSTRSTSKEGTAFTNLNKEALEKDNLGEDLPFLIDNTTSLVATNESGIGVGYTGIRIRGSDATRVNVTINGIPFNDSESLGTYFVDVPDLAGSINSIQIQRGVGTSTNGDGAFGGSLNIETSNFEPRAYVTSTNSFGSYNTVKNNIQFGSGLLDNHFNFSLRISRITSDGYIERASSDLHSYFFSAGYFGKKDFLKLNIFSGTEKTYLDYLGVPGDSLAHHRKYNPFTYPNETDNYLQDHAQLFYSRTLDTNLRLNIAFHLTHGKGYYEQYEADQAFSTYNLPNIIIGDSAIGTTNLIQRQWLDNYFYGTTYSLLYNNTQKKYTLNLGGAYNQYTGLHFGEIIWATYAQAIPFNDRYYQFNGFKTDFNSYLKISKEINLLSTSLDLQFRHIFYRFLGYNNALQNVNQSVSLSFFNPKLGLNYALSDHQGIYASYGIAHKEPNQTDYSGSTPSNRPKPEQLGDLELGYKYHHRQFSFGFNFYWMNYWNQLVLTGRINSVGAYIDTNTARSSRTGIESEWEIKLSSHLHFLGNFSFSRNKIAQFTQFYPNYTNLSSTNFTAQIPVNYTNTTIGYSPNIISSLTLDYSPFHTFHILFISKYVGKQYLDNTQNETRKIDPYFVQNIKIHYAIQPAAFKEIQFSITLNNIFSNLYISDGYSSPEILQGQVVNNNNYFPQAPFNLLGGIILKF